jgi:hypothetical protein
LDFVALLFVKEVSVLVQWNLRKAVECEVMAFHNFVVEKINSLKVMVGKM